MEFKGPAHVYKCVPRVLGIREEWDAYLEGKAAAETKGVDPPVELKPVTINIKRFTQPEISQAVIEDRAMSEAFNPEEAMSKIDGATIARIKEKVAGFDNLIVDGKEIKTFDECYQDGPPELVQWIFRAVYSSFILDEAEIKN